MRFSLIVAFSALASSAYASHYICIMAKKGHGTNLDLSRDGGVRSHFSDPSVPPSQLNLADPSTNFRMTVLLSNSEGRFQVSDNGVPWEGGKWYVMKKTGPTANGHTYWEGCWNTANNPNFCSNVMDVCTHHEFIEIPIL
ncbi:hypothetical protein B0O80DRAFT_463378, partial [Mortierella sp. GBAus27b]